MKFTAAVICLLAIVTAHAEDKDTIVLKSNLVQRVLKKDGDVWRTVRFARADGSDAIDVQSDEFHILPMGSEKGWTINDYREEGEKDVFALVIHGVTVTGYTFNYVPKPGLPASAPSKVRVEYGRERSVLTKRVFLEFTSPQSVDRLQVERFSTKTPASRGGRGEPVFCGAWFFGLDYPASWNAQSTTPIGRPYDKLGNFSFISLDGREKEFEPRDGLITLAHFPGLTRTTVLNIVDENARKVDVRASKIAVAGIGNPGDTPELAFLDYLNTIRRPVRSFIHYNNWYDGTGKNLKPENFVDKVAHEFMTQMKPFGVKVDAFVPDNGWQNRNSIWQPNARQFPEGMKSFADLGAALKKEGTSLGLWFTLNGYELNTDWGLKNGYFEAQRNPHFSRFNRYYSLGDPHYNTDLSRQLSALIKDGQLNYIKHDFNDMCDAGPHNGTLPTDRHGHEKAVDETLSILKMERDINPDIFQNVTNWAWFSPWWLQHCNTIWMLSDDTGANRKWPAISDWQMATTYRDAHLFKAWGDPATRPLVPISHLMTHGIVNATGAADGSMSDPLSEWADYVLMYYARGVQLKEWYITPGKMDAAHWKVLGELSKWAQENSSTLANAVYVGGNPEKGEPYGYVSWNGDKAIVVVRNPDSKLQSLTVPFDKSVFYRGATGREFGMTPFYPYKWAERSRHDTIKSGEAIRLSISGWSTAAYEIGPLPPPLPHGDWAPPTKPIGAADINVDNHLCAFDLNLITEPASPPRRCTLALTTRNGELPGVQVDGKPLTSITKSAGTGWKSASFDLLPFWSKKIHIEIAPQSAGIFPSAAGETSVHLLADHNPSNSALFVPVQLPYYTVELFPPLKFTSVTARPITPAQLQTITAAKLRIDLFGSDAGQYANKKLLINGTPILTLPANKHGDNWEEFILDLPADALKKITQSNTLRITNPSNDKFKFRHLTLAVKLPDESWATTNADTRTHCHDAEWAHFEGSPFKNSASDEIELRFDSK